MEASTVRSGQKDVPPLSQQAAAISVNILSLFALWMFWTGGNFSNSPDFFAWTGKNPSLHRAGIAAAFALFGFILFAAAKILPAAARPKIWVFRLWSLLNQTKNAWVAGALAVFSVWLLGRAAVARYDSFSSGFDLAIFDQAIWSTLHGKFLWSSIKGHICLLGDHMSPILLVYVPLMALWEDARVLLWSQAAVAGVNGWLIYCLCRQKWEKSPLNWVFPLAYFLYLPVRNVVRFDFHPEVLADTFILLSFWFLNRGRKAGFLACLLGLVLCKETFWALVFFYGVYLCLFAPKAWGKSGRVLGLILLVLAPAAFWLEIHWLIPSLSGKPYPYTGNYNAANVSVLLGQAFSLSSLGYLAKIFAPLGFLSFFSPATLVLACFGLLQNLFSVNPATHSIFFQYTIGLTPFVFLAAINGAHAITQGRVRFAAGMGENRLALWLLAFSVLFSGVSENYLYRYYRAQRTPRLEAIEARLKEIPPDAAVKTNEFFAPHISHRMYLYIPDDGGFWPFEKGAEPGLEKYAVMGEGFGSGASEENIAFLDAHGYRMIEQDGGMSIMMEEIQP